ncbi:U4/U6-U5 snRNP complex subunit lsm6 [Endocarpon pusillum]|uniref:U6 snRNA-associated Sm-like protein LSm6 n=1 Tax=Endocarpon pusillum TaxID=364733 RepID=A0A8H7A847_9EURO|nr:U4/U6-U5 snRNP complex subunit lsm6 [Endocarpon pusillum]
MENHTNANTSAVPDGKDPSAFLSEIIGVPVTVKLHSGIIYKGSPVSSTKYSDLIDQTGELQSVDGYMNIALEKCQEYVNGQLRRTYGDAFVRGNNG